VLYKFAVDNLTAVGDSTDRELVCRRIVLRVATATSGPSKTVSLPRFSMAPIHDAAHLQRVPLYLSVVFDASRLVRLAVSNIDRVAHSRLYRNSPIKHWVSAPPCLPSTGAVAQRLLLIPFYCFLGLPWLFPSI